MTGSAAFPPEDYACTDRAVFSIEGLYCPSCAAAVERALRGAPGVEAAQVSYASASAAVRWQPGTDLGTLAARVGRLGFEMRPLMQNAESDSRIGEEMRRFAIRLAVATVFGIWTMMIAVAVYLGPPEMGDPALARALAFASGATALPVVGYAGLPLYLSGWRTLRAGAPGMDTLVSLGVLGATAGSLLSLALGRGEVWFDTAVMLVTLLLVARLVEMATLRRSARALASVEAALPDRALVLREGKRREVLAHEVAVGEQVLIAPGMAVTLDGVIAEGESAFDTSSLTGESLPRTKRTGDRIEAGWINLDAPVTLTVEAPVGARRIDRLGADVEAMLHDRPEIHALADRIAGMIVPVALSLVALTALVWGLAGLPAEDVALRALSVLVIACPCAISLAAPVSHLAAVSRASGDGLLLRRQSATETLGALRTLVVDKTGTLTEGRPRVTDVALAPGETRAGVLALAAAAEGALPHPLATAIRDAAPGTLPEAQAQFREADGVSATVGGEQVRVGSADHLRRAGIAPLETGMSGTVVHVARDRRAIAALRIADRLRPDAAATVATLHEAGIRIVMATGDDRGAALDVARALGLPGRDVHASLTPEGKVALLRDLPRPLGFLGDGLNDTGALVAADVGIAVSEANSASVAVADVVLTRGGLTGVLRACTLSRRARAVLRQNLGFALVYNLAALVLAFEGAVPPAAAALAMTASSLTVLANASRLARTGARTEPAPTPRTAA